MTVANLFDLGEIVYLKTDKDQLPRMVVAIHVTLAGVKYQLSSGTTSDYTYAEEISREKSFLSNASKVGFGSASVK